MGSTERCHEPLFHSLHIRHFLGTPTPRFQTVFPFTFTNLMFSVAFWADYGLVGKSRINNFIGKVKTANKTLELFCHASFLIKS